MGEQRWIKRFTEVNRTGAYLRVLRPGEVRAGDPIEIVHRPERSVSIAEAFRIYMHEPESLARLLDAEGLPAGMADEIRDRLTRVKPVR